MPIAIGGRDTSGGYGSVGPGYENPLPPITPSWGGGAWDWAGASKGIDWQNSKFDVAKDNDWAENFSKLFEKTRKTDKYRSEAERPYFGEGLKGGGGNVLENLGVYQAPQQAPYVKPGTPGSPGIGGVLGSGLGAIAGSFIPGVGTALGASLGGGIGGLFS